MFNTRAKNQSLESHPEEFYIEQYGWQCKLGFRGNIEYGDYELWINGTTVQDLPKAPAIPKDKISAVCQSDTLIYRGEVTTRFTFQVFVEGVMSQIVAEHNARSLCTSVEVDGKLNKQWEGLTLT